MAGCSGGGRVRHRVPGPEQLGPEARAQEDVRQQRQGPLRLQEGDQHCGECWVLVEQETNLRKV